MSERQKLRLTAAICIVSDLAALTAALFLLRTDISLGKKLLIAGLYMLLLISSICLIAARNKIMHLRERMGKSDRMLEEEQLRVTGMELEKKQQELQALQSQINPHFLYNTLDTFRGLAIEGGDRQLADMLGALSAMFKYSVNYTVELVTYSVEMNYLKHYIRIQQLRFPGRFSFEEHVLCDARQLSIQECPRFVLQPLAENAIRHGLRDVRSGGVISVTAEVKKDSFVITVSDNGCGMPPDDVLRMNNVLEGKIDGQIHSTGDGGIGIANVNRRIKIYCGKAYGVRVASTRDIGTQFIVCLPLSREDEYE